MSNNRNKQTRQASRNGGATQVAVSRVCVFVCGGRQFGEFGAQMFADCKGYAARTLATISQVKTHNGHECGTKSMQG